MRVYFAVPWSAKRRTSLGVIALLIAGLLMGSALELSTPANAQDVPDVLSTATEADAALIAARYDHPVTAIDDTTETSTTEILPGGARRSTDWTDPVRVQNAAGDWVDVDPSLELTSDGTFSPAASPVPVAFSAGGNGPLAVVPTRSGAPISLAWTAGVLPVPVVTGSTVTYADVYPDVDLRLTATATGMSEVLVINTAAAAANPELASVDFGVSGAVLTTSDGGTIAATAADGSKALSPAPTSWDSAGGGTADGPGGLGSEAPVTVHVESDTETINAAAAASTTATFPVFVDPDFSVTQVNRTFVDKTFSSRGYWNGAGASDTYQHVGYIDGPHADDGLDHTARSYWQMPTSKYAGRVIENATFSVDLKYSSSCQARVVKLYSTPAVSSGTTWDNQPTQGSWAFQDARSYAAGHDSSCGAKSVEFTATDAVQTAANGSKANTYLMLYADEGDWLAWKKFGGNAAMQVTYHTRPTFTGTFDSSCRRTPGLYLRDRLNPGDVRYSANGLFVLDMQGDGNLVLYRSSTANQLTNQVALWSSATTNNAGAWATFQSDGNLVVSSPVDGGALWNSGTVAAEPGQYLDLQDDGNLVAYNRFGQVRWNSGTSNQATGIATICYSNVNQNHIFRAIATTNGITSSGSTPTEKIDYELQIKYVNAQGTNMDYTEPMGTAISSGSSGTYVFDTFGPNTNFDWRVTACLHDATSICTTSAWKRTFEYYAPNGPADPALTVSGPISTDPLEGNSGLVGTDHNVVTLTPSSAPNTTKPFGYLYAVLNGTYVDQTSPSAPGSGPGCGNPLDTAGYTQVCGSIVNQPMAISIAAINLSSYGVYYAFDVYGNRSPVPSAHVNLFAVADSTAVRAGHSWDTGPADTGPTGNTTCPHDPVVDSLPGNTGNTNLSFAGGACRLGTTNATTLTDTTFPTNDLHLNSTTGYGYTTNPVVDTGSDHTFTVGAWLYPTTNQTAGYTALSGHGSHVGRFYLQDVGVPASTSDPTVHNRWRFCLPRQDVDTQFITCSTSATDVEPNKWTFVAGTYDAINQQLRLYVSTNGAMTAPATALYQGAMPSSQPTALDVGANLTPGNQMAAFWPGEISQPFIVQAALTSSQFSALGSGLKRPDAT